MPNPSQYPTLQPGSTSSHHNTEEDHADIYDVSLFHQIHCLTHVRTYLYTMQASLNQTNPHSTYEILLKPQEDHVEHCFDYLRQALMCAGDVTLEWPREEADGRRFAVDGWGVEHQCKSWVSVDNASSAASLCGDVLTTLLLGRDYELHDGAHGRKAVLNSPRGIEPPMLALAVN